jgi:hypothetical protein
LNLEIVSLFLLLLLFYVYRRIQTGFGDGDWTSFPPQGCLGFFYGIRIRGILAVRKAAGTLHGIRLHYLLGRPARSGLGLGSGFWECMDGGGDDSDMAGLLMGEHGGGWDSVNLKG